MHVQDRCGCAGEDSSQTVATVDESVTKHAGVAEADVIVLVCDGQAGPVASEDEIVAWLRRHHPTKKVILAINKCESSSQGDVLAAQFWGYGMEPLAVSAISGTGTGDLMERILEVCSQSSQFAYYFLSKSNRYSCVPDCVTLNRACQIPSTLFI